jgi:hypothetical protein
MCSAKDNRQPVTQRSYRSSVSPELRYGHWEIDLPSANANRPSTKAQRKLASVSRSIREPLQELLQNPPRVLNNFSTRTGNACGDAVQSRRKPARGRRGSAPAPQAAGYDPAVFSRYDTLPEGAHARMSAYRPAKRSFLPYPAREPGRRTATFQTSGWLAGSTETMIPTKVRT